MMLRNLLKLGGILMLLSLANCATNKIPVATGGSRADGTVEMSYQYNEIEKPVVDWAKAEATAKQKCAAWGYTGAQPFGGSTSKCNDFNQYGCTSTLVTTVYQCTNK